MVGQMVVSSSSSLSSQKRRKKPFLLSSAVKQRSHFHSISSRGSMDIVSLLSSAQSALPSKTSHDICTESESDRVSSCVTPYYWIGGTFSTADRDRCGAVPPHVNKMPPSPSTSRNSEENEAEAALTKNVEKTQRIVVVVVACKSAHALLRRMPSDKIFRCSPRLGERASGWRLVRARGTANCRIGMAVTLPSSSTYFYGWGKVDGC